jgi:hypothetical protein
VQSVHGEHAHTARPTLNDPEVVAKINEIIDRLNEEPTAQELIYHLSESHFGTDVALSISLARALHRWKATRA